MVVPFNVDYYQVVALDVKDFVACSLNLVDYHFRLDFDKDQVAFRLAFSLTFVDFDLRLHFAIIVNQNCHAATLLLLLNILSKNFYFMASQALPRCCRSYVYQAHQQQLALQQQDQVSLAFSLPYSGFILGTKHTFSYLNQIFQETGQSNLFLSCSAGTKGTWEYFRCHLLLLRT